MNWAEIANFGFGQPWWLLLLPLLLWWHLRRRAEAVPGIAHSSTSPLAHHAARARWRPATLLRCTRTIALALIVFALARPRVPSGDAPDPSKGIDIMLVCDVSKSMDTPDFSQGEKKITRREALLQAISEFVENRASDRIGMIGFALHTYLLSPLTTDGEWIKNVFRLVELKGGTAIGDGIYAGVSKLEENAGRSKVIVLVTDGLNNEGTNPFDAAEYAREKGIRIHALEIMDIRNIRAERATSAPLSQVAARTGGQYFQASDTDALLQIYRQIDRMEKKPFEGSRHTLYDEWWPWLVWTAFALLLFEAVAARTFWMRLP